VFPKSLLQRLCMIVLCLMPDGFTRGKGGSVIVLSVGEVMTTVYSQFPFAALSP
jgi:hypothetical protein